MSLVNPRLTFTNTCLGQSDGAAAAARIIFKYRTTWSVCKRPKKQYNKRFIFLEFVVFLNLKPAHKFLGLLCTDGQSNLYKTARLLFLCLIKASGGTRWNASFPSPVLFIFDLDPRIYRTPYVTKTKLVKHELRFIRRPTASVEQDKIEKQPSALDGRKKEEVVVVA